MLGAIPGFDSDQVAKIKNLIKINGLPITDTDSLIEIKTGDKIELPGQTYIYVYGFNEAIHSKGTVRTSQGKVKEVDIPKGLTMDNHTELMGHRFKMTKREVQIFGHHPKDEARKLAFNDRYKLCGD